MRAFKRFKYFTVFANSYKVSREDNFWIIKTVLYRIVHYMFWVPIWVTVVDKYIIKHLPLFELNHQLNIFTLLKISLLFI